MNQINDAKAVFVAEGVADTIARVQPRDNGGVDFRVDIKDFRLASGTATASETLPLAESLQFVSDVISASIPGRLSPFVRGWINTASDVHQLALAQGIWGESDSQLEAMQKNPASEEPYSLIPEFKAIEIAFAIAAMKVMDLAHTSGYRLAQAIEAVVKNKIKLGE